MENIHLVILTPNKVLIDEQNVTEVFFPGDHSTVGVLANHAPMITSVGTGVVIYSLKEISGFFKVAGGVAEVSNNLVTLLVDVGEEASNIDLERAKRALERAEGRLAAKDLGNVDVKRAQSSKDRALARIQTANLYHTKSSKSLKQDSESNDN